MPCQSFLRPGEVPKEQRVETVLFAGSKKLFGIGRVVNSRFRSLQKLLRVTFYVTRFVENSKVILVKDVKVCSGEI